MYELIQDLPYFSETADTYLLLEFINGRKYPEAAIKGFADDLERDIYRIVGDCYPKQVSSLNDREDFKPGWIKGGSQVFVSRFHTQTDVAAVLNSREFFSVLNYLQIYK